MSDSEQKVEEATSSNEIAVDEPDSSENLPSKEKPLENGDVNSSSKDALVETNAENEVTSSVRAPKRRISETVIEISDSESDGSSVCAVDSYRVSADEAKRIRGDYSSSSGSYSSEEEEDVTFEDDSIVLNLNSFLSNSGKPSLNKRADRDDLPKLNKTFKSEESKIKLKNQWKDSVDYSCENINLLAEPFRLCVLENFLENSEFINNIVDDMNTLDWNRKRMDLYEFHQTTDLANFTWQRNICSIYQLLKSEVMPWVAEVTDTNLTHLSASCSLYGPGDHLLVHDDLMGDRKVAFIFYISPWNFEGNNDEQKSGWNEQMGGSLELFAKDDRGKPVNEATKRLFPKNNSLAFFKVGPETFHQVAEVKSLEYPRLSINGWFHGPGEENANDADGAKVQRDVDVETFKPHNEIVIMNEWLNDTYQLPRTRIQIQRQMEEASEISLEKLFIDGKFQELADALRTADIWEQAGPPDERRYEVIQRDKLAALPDDNMFKKWYQLVTSTMFFNFLISCTELKLSTYCDVEVQRWTSGCYTLLPPKKRYSVSELDAIMFVDLAHFGCGVTTYIAPEETNTEPLVTLATASNALNLVYSDEGTASFTKYVSKLSSARDHYFYVLRISYRE